MKLSERMRNMALSWVAPYEQKGFDLIDEVAQLEEENEAYKWLIRKLPLRLFDEIADKSPPHIWKHFYSDGPGVEDD